MVIIFGGSRIAQKPLYTSTMPYKNLCYVFLGKSYTLSSCRVSKYCVMLVQSPRSNNIAHCLGHPVFTLVWSVKKCLIGEHVSCLSFFCFTPGGWQNKILMISSNLLKMLAIQVLRLQSISTFDLAPWLLITNRKR